MKKGKTSRILGYKTAKIIYGTVDSKSLKSIYINLQTWVNPKTDQEINWERVILNTSRFIKHSVLESLDNNIFEKNFIVDLDLRSSGIYHGKKSFMNLEINLYLKEEMDFKSSILKNSIKKIVQNIFLDVINKHQYFEFSLSKKQKVLVYSE
jgi:dihydropteroate synthase